MKKYSSYKVIIMGGVLLVVGILFSLFYFPRIEPFTHPALERPIDYHDLVQAVEDSPIDPEEGDNVFRLSSVQDWYQNYTHPDLDNYLPPRCPSEICQQSSPHGKDAPTGLYQPADKNSPCWEQDRCHPNALPWEKNHRNCRCIDGKDRCHLCWPMPSRVDLTTKSSQENEAIYHYLFSH